MNDDYPDIYRFLPMDTTEPVHIKILKNRSHTISRTYYQWHIPEPPQKHFDEGLFEI